MTRMLFATAAVALAAAVIGGPANATALMDRPALVVPVPAPTARAQPAQWHYEWQYHYNRWSEYVPGWVAVPNS
jgi:hypothetical protein